MNVVIIVAHADDEALGCGGTIARHVAEGDNVSIIYLADGITSRTDEKMDIEKRQSAAEKVQSVLGFNESYFLGFPDNRMDSLSLLDIVQPLEKIINELAPVAVYTHHYGDLNIDHRITHDAVMTSCRPQPGSSVRKILTFEVMSSTEWNSPALAPFLPNHFVDISDYLNVKMQALDVYELEMRAVPHSRNKEHLALLAAHHGHCMGMAAAEAFMVIRYLR